MQSSVRDPYQVLGVGRDASDDDIKAAFRRLAREHHPDRNPGDPDAQRRFTEINAAYQVLSDRERRERFEQRYGAGSGAAGSGAAGSGPWGGAPDGMGGFDFGSAGFGRGGIEDWLSEILRSGFAAPRATDNGDIEQTLDLSFEEAALGCVRQVSYQRRDLCGTCSGTGAAPGTRARECRACKGAGRLRLEALGWLALGMDRPCPECRGTGQLPEQHCTECNGHGLVERKRTINLTIPAGIESGSEETVISGGSRVTPTQPAGDLHFRMNVAPHPHFRREGDDIESDVTISFSRAALGGELEVPTLHGNAALRIAAGTPHAALIKLRGKGVPHRFRSGAGDHYCKIKIEVPRRLTPEVRRLLDEYEHALAQGDDGGVLGRLKSLFSG